MNHDLKKILSGSNNDIDDQQLLDYLNNQLSEAESHAIEKNMADDDFMNDAVEGLQKIESKKEMLTYVEQLNSDLHKQIAKNKKRKSKRGLKDETNNYFIIVLILILLIISFVIIKKHLDAKRTQSANTHQVTNSWLEL